MGKRQKKKGWEREGKEEGRGGKGREKEEKRSEK